MCALLQEKGGRAPKVTQRSSGPLPRLPEETMGVGQPWGHNPCLDLGSVSEESQGLSSTLLSHVGDIATPQGPKGRALSQRRLFSSLEISWNLLCHV